MLSVLVTVVCCELFDESRLLCVVLCGLSSKVCYVLFDVCCLVFVVCCLLFVDCCLLLCV